jgi:hypothetical protein
MILLGPGLVPIPERLLLAQGIGDVVFVAGAGVSQPALPNFRGLVVEVYARLDSPVHEVISRIAESTAGPDDIEMRGLTDPQKAEVKRFVTGEYDVVLGMLERRMDGRSHARSDVRQAVGAILRKPLAEPAPIHRHLMRLADRGGSVTIITTNFELLLERAAKRLTPPVQTYALGGIPRPGRSIDFAGVFHIHGALDRNPGKISDLILTDQDFGEFYLRRRVVADFIYDAARLFSLVLVGYSANDPPMKYLLNAVAADGNRFSDLKERFTFLGQTEPDPVELEDWKGRGITPIPYHAPANDHSVLTRTFRRWSELSPVNGRKGLVDAEIKRIARTSRDAASEPDRDLFDHFIRRSDANERVRLSSLVSRQKADLGWLDAVVRISAETSESRP